MGIRFLPVDGGEGDPRFDALATLWTVKDKLAEAADVWDRMDEADRVAAADYAPEFLDNTKRSHVEGLSTWLRGRSWRYVKRPPPGQGTLALTPSAPAVWEPIIQELWSNLGDPLYRSWFGKAVFDEPRGDRVSVTLPSEFVRKHVMTNYGDRLRELWSPHGIAVIDFHAARPTGNA